MEKVNIIIPAYNEEKGIAGVIDEIQKTMNEAGIEFELTIVNDGSTDKTSEIVLQKNVKLIEHGQNKGYGASLKTGISSSDANIIIITDADGTYPAAEIPKLLPEIKNCDMVVGARTGKVFKTSFLRRFAKFFLTRLANYLSGAKIIDINSGLRVMKKDLVEKYFHLLPSGFSFTTTITLAFLSDNYIIKYIPVDYLRRKGKSKIHPIKDTIRFFMLIINTIIYFNPSKVFIPFSMLFILLGTGKLIFDITKLANVTDTSIFLLLTGIIISAIGLLANLITRNRKLHEEILYQIKKADFTKKEGQ